MTEAAPPVAELLTLGGRVALATGASGGVRWRRDRPGAPFDPSGSGDEERRHPRPLDKTLDLVVPGRAGEAFGRVEHGGE